MTKMKPKSKNSSIKLDSKSKRFLFKLTFMLLVCFHSIVSFAQGTPGTFYVHSFWRDGVADGDPLNTIVYPSNIGNPFILGGYVQPYNGQGYFDSHAGRIALANLAKAYLNPLPNGKRHMFGQAVGPMYTNFGVWTSNGSLASLNAVKDAWSDFFQIYASIGGKVDYVSLDIEGYYSTMFQGMKYAVTDPVIQYFPNAAVTHYDNYLIDYVNFPVKNVYGDSVYGDAVAGTHLNPVLYGWCQNTLNNQLGAPLNRFKIFMHDVDLMRATRLTTPNVPIRPYIAWPTYNWHRTEGNTGLSETAPLAVGPDVATQTQYYREMMYHVALEGADEYVLFAINPPYGATPINQLTTQPDINLLSNILIELDEIIGYPNRRPLLTSTMSRGLLPDDIATNINPIYNNQKYVLSGMQAGGRNVWRISCDLSVVSQTAFKTNNNPLTFSVPGVNIVFPTGSALYNPANNNGQAGFWVTSPIGTSPIINGVPVIIAPQVASTENVSSLLTTQLPSVTETQPYLNAYDYGMKFKSSVPGQILKIKYYKPSGETGVHNGYIWSANGERLAGVTFTNETAAGWQEATLPYPLYINANEILTVSVNANVKCAITEYGLQNIVSNGFLSSIAGNNGVFGYSSPGVYPLNFTNRDSNYFRDVVFRPSATNTLSISENQFDSTGNKVLVYPNPNYGEVINFKSDELIENIKIIDVLGKVIFEKNDNTNLLQIDTSKFSKGIYGAIIKTASGELVRKKIIVN
jgi:hypothetical protein